MKLGFRKEAHFWSLFFNECFEVYHTERDIKTSLHIFVQIHFYELCKDFLMFYWYLRDV